ncbi:DUF5994 family protein [Streptomyces sp. NPDC018019]|uniref:DUF5994 family protein n=1 Tax=Streptomyces sp. NPDC018019 TaxID=3365030 RepID=UPI0037974A6F
MTVITERPSPAAPTAGPSVHPPVRLSLKPSGSQTRLLDGAWWPRSRDLARELPALAEQLEPLWGRITRITVNPTHWPVVPRKIPANDRVIKVGWFTDEQDPHQLLLLSYRVGRWDLLIVPPETGAAAAARLMDAASDPHTARTGSELMAAAPARHPAASAVAAPPGPTETWEAEGGAMAAPVSTTDGR